MNWQSPHPKKSGASGSSLPIHQKYAENTEYHTDECAYGKALVESTTPLKPLQVV